MVIYFYNDSVYRKLVDRQRHITRKIMKKRADNTIRPIIRKMMGLIIGPVQGVFYKRTLVG